MISMNSTPNRDSRMLPSLESVLCTEELNRRPSRPPDYIRQNSALQLLAQALADSPRTILQTLADTILKLFQCGSVGISLLTEDGKRFYWPAIAGEWKPHVGGGTPREFGPCGDVLDRNCILMFNHPERRYVYLQSATPPADECLLVPFYVEGKAVGTIWAITHDEQPGARRFDNEDLRILVSLGAFASAAYQVVEQLDALGKQSHERQEGEQVIREMNEALLVSSVRQHELTEQATNAETAMRESETRYRRLFETAQDGILILDAQTCKITDANPFIGELLGYSHVELIGKELWEIGLFKDIAESKTAVRELQEKLYIRYDDLPLKTKLERRVEVELVSNVYREDDHPVIQCNIRDITERKRLDAELRRYAVELSEADRHKNEFLAILAHELRNPLAPIRNALQIMRLTDGNSEAVQSASEMMERQVAQMARLVDDLLDVSRVSRGTIELRRGRIELSSALNHAVAAAGSLIKSMEHDLTVTLPTQPIYLNADPTRLAQLVGNLLTNACKFTDKGGRISLTVKREGDQAVIRVQDNGIGIAPEQLPRLFEMFMQVDTSLERSVSGLGIGLMLVKNLVELHDGTVEVHSAGIGQGSEFLVRLPVLPETSETLSLEPTAINPPSTIARRILVVDDNWDSAKTMALLLKLTGNATRTAHDGLEAVEAAAAFRPDVVLLDIGLPKLNGYEAACRIREQPWGKDMVLVALTGWGQDEDRRKSRDAGFNGHMVKPVDHTALMKLLAELQPTLN